jgi:hypothetical protein
MRSRSIILAFILITTLSLQSSALEIDLLDPSHSWRSPNRDTQISFADSKLIISSVHSSIGIYNQKPLNLSAKDFNLLIIRMKASKGGIGEISWRSGKEPFAPERNFSFYLKSPDKYHTYYLNLKPYLKEKNIGQVLFFPFNKEGKAELTGFKFIKGTLWQKALAGWQEFWGPIGRNYTGKSFFVLKSPMLFGKSIFFYLNWLIAVSLLVSLLFKRPRFTITSILVLWILLEASSAVNNWIFFKDDLRFWEKNLEEKRAIQNAKDFYQFMKFAEKKIPPDSDFDLVAAPKYPYSRERAGYYLYPRKLKEKAAYLLIFDLEPGKDILEKYKLIGKFRKGAYILKSKNANY